MISREWKETLLDMIPGLIQLFLIAAAGAALVLIELIVL